MSNSLALAVSVVSTLGVVGVVGVVAVVGVPKILLRSRSTRSQELINPPSDIVLSNPPT